MGGAEAGVGGAAVVPGEAAPRGATFDPGNPLAAVGPPSACVCAAVSAGVAAELPLPLPDRDEVF